MSTSNRLRRFRTPLLWLAGVRAVLSIAAIPLAPFLYKKHFVVLVLLRPTKDVLLAGGFLIKRHDANLPLVLAAAVPLAIFGVWHFYSLGRGFSKEIQSGHGLPRFFDRLLPTKRIKQLCGVLEEKGKRVVFIGRLASFPSALLGAAAGASDMSSKEFLPSDLAGGLLSIAEVVAAGYLFGEAYKKAGPWITAVGVVLLIALLVGVGRSLTRQPA
jgi:membrane protein DedA with SNARE-associated domain